VTPRLTFLVIFSATINPCSNLYTSTSYISPLQRLVGWCQDARKAFFSDNEFYLMHALQ